MALQSFVAFRAYVDGLSISVTAKGAIKAEGVTLAKAAVREAIVHTVKHLDVILTDNLGDTEIAARVVQLKKYLKAVRLAND